MLWAWILYLYRERIESLSHASSHQELRGLDLTQEEFTRRIGISLNYLSTMELGKVQIGSENVGQWGRCGPVRSPPHSTALTCGLARSSAKRYRGAMCRAV
jgi:hypothetical protein